MDYHFAVAVVVAVEPRMDYFVFVVVVTLRMDSKNTDYPHSHYTMAVVDDVHRDYLSAEVVRIHHTDSTVVGQHSYIHCFAVVACMDSFVVVVVVVVVAVLVAYIHLVPHVAAYSFVESQFPMNPT